MAYTVHQCARCSSDHKQSHGEAVKHLTRHLKGTRDKGLISRPTNKQFHCYIDADFAGNWDKEESTSDADMA
jgi:hypothetical protein